jgi:6-phosphogluconate dehydrogenase
MQIGLIGLGRMGGNMAKRLAAGGHDVVAWDRSPQAAAASAASGLTVASSLDDLIGRLQPPRPVWVMVPSGAPTEETIASLAAALSTGDIIVDGGNTHYKDDVRRGRELAPRGIAYLDVGTSGGVWGAERGYCLMIGGPAPAVERLRPIFRTLAPGPGTVAPASDRAGTAAEGFLHCGPTGAGHFAKMVHNGIEYGLMQAYAEGFDLLRHAGDDGRAEGQQYDFDLAGIAELWRRGSVVSSWLLDLTARALAADPRLDSFEGRVADSGEGRWTVEAAIEEAVPTPVIAAALFARFRSRRNPTFADQLLSALRHEFGGHTEKS